MSKIEPQINSQRLRRTGSGRWRNDNDEVDVVIYKESTDEPGYAKCIRVEIPGFDTVSYTPGPGHLFTMDGIDIHTGEKTTWEGILNYVANK